MGIPTGRSAAPSVRLHRPPSSPRSVAEKSNTLLLAHRGVLQTSMAFLLTMVTLQLIPNLPGMGG